MRSEHETHCNSSPAELSRNEQAVHLIPPGCVFGHDLLTLLGVSPDVPPLQAS